MVEGEPSPAGYRPGLLHHGWSGVALGLLRVAEIVDDPRAASAQYRGDAAARLRSCAVRAVLREVGAARWHNGALLAVDQRRHMPYLGTGSAALGLAADAVRPWVDQSRRGELDEVIRGVRAAMTLPTVLCGGLMHGRAGIITTLERLDPGCTAVRRHRDRLRWVVVRARDDRRRDDGEFTAGDLVLGDQNLRCSADLGTGAAGVLLAASHLEVDPLSTVLRLPSSGVVQGGPSFAARRSEGA